MLEAVCCALRVCDWGFDLPIVADNCQENPSESTISNISKQDKAMSARRRRSLPLLLLTWEGESVCAGGNSDFSMSGKSKGVIGRWTSSRSVSGKTIVI